MNIDLGTIIVSKQGRHLRSVDPDTCQNPEFVVPGVPPVPQIRQYRDNKEKDTHKKQRKYGPPVQVTKYWETRYLKSLIGLH